MRHHPRNPFKEDAMLNIRLKQFRADLFERVPRTEVILYYNGRGPSRKARRRTDRRGMSMKIESYDRPKLVGKIVSDLAARYGLTLRSSSTLPVQRIDRARQPGIEPRRRAETAYKFFVAVPRGGGWHSGEIKPARKADQV